MKKPKFLRRGSRRSLGTIVAEASITKGRLRVIVGGFAPPDPKKTRGRTQAADAGARRTKRLQDARSRLERALLDLISGD
jgi:hypothetical protein